VAANDSDNGNNNQKGPVVDLEVIHDPLGVTLDTYHHDAPERHLFGLAFHNPVDPQPIGTVPFPGISDTPAREDHVHGGGGSGGGGTPGTTVTNSAVGDVPVVGTSTNFAREDHKHGRESFGLVSAETVFGAVSNDGSATTVSHSDHKHGNPTHGAPDHTTIPLSTFAPPTASVSFGSQKIINLADPTAGTDGANKEYVDGLVAGLGTVKKFAVNLLGTSTYAAGEVVTHNLNTRDIDISVVSTASPYAAVEVDWEATTLNTATLRYNPPLTPSSGPENILVAGAPNAVATNWEFGVIITFAVAGTITAVQYYRLNTAANDLHLRAWDPASTAFPLFDVPENPAGASSSGRFTVTLGTPLSIAAGVTRRFSIGSTGSVPGYNAAGQTVTNSPNCSFGGFAYNGAANNYPGTTTPLWSHYVEPIFVPTGGGTLYRAVVMG